MKTFYLDRQGVVARSFVYGEEDLKTMITDIRHIRRTQAEGVVFLTYLHGATAEKAMSLWKPAGADSWLVR